MVTLSTVWSVLSGSRQSGGARRGALCSTREMRRTERKNLYAMLSERGNPVLSRLSAILDAFGLRRSISRKQAA